jgi:hypothetical protein
MELIDRKPLPKKGIPGTEYLVGFKYLRNDVVYLGYTFRGNGTLGKKLEWLCFAKCSELITCEFCGLVRSSKYIKYRSDVACVEIDDKYYDKLCTGCWNKLKPILKKEQELRELKKLTNKLKRERLSCRKNQ